MLNPKDARWNWNYEQLAKSTGVFDISKKDRNGVFMHSVIQDPERVLNSTGIGLQKPSLVTFQTLRSLAERCPVIGAIITTRQNQVANFCKRPNQQGLPGCEVRLKDKDRKPTKSDKRRCNEVLDFFLNMRDKSNKNDAMFRRGVDYPEGGFDRFVRAVVRDLLELDALAIERIKTQNGKLFTMWPVDAGTIFPVPIEKHFIKPDDEHTKDHESGREKTILEHLIAQKQELYGRDWESIRYIQKLSANNKTHEAKYTAEELYYGFMNPRTSVLKVGYGFSPIEQMILVVTGLLFGMDYNNKAFTQGTLSPGIVMLSGNYSTEAIGEFKNVWSQQLQGVHNAFRVPVLVNDDDGGKGKMEYIKMKDSNRDMEFGEYQKFLTNVACSIYNIAPEEINFSTNGKSQTSLNDRGPKDEIEAGQDKGLKPLLTFLSNMFTEEIVSRFYDDLEFCFINLTKNDAKAEIDLAKAKIDAGVLTVNEYRAQHDEEPVPKEEMWGDAPANPQLLQVYLQGAKSFLDAQEAAGGAEGEEGMDGGDMDFGFEDEQGNPQDEEDITGAVAGDEEDITDAMVKSITRESVSAFDEIEVEFV